MPSAKYSCSGSELRLANGSTAIEGCQEAQVPASVARFDRRRGVIQQNAVDLHGVVNILELVLTKILEGDAEPPETAFRVFLHSARHADAASFCQRL